MEAGLFRDGRIGVDGVVVPTQPVDEGDLARRRDLMGGIRLAFRKFWSNSGGSAETTKSTVTPEKIGLLNLREQLSGGVIELLFEAHRRAATWTLVDDTGYAVLRRDSSFDWQRTVNFVVVLAMKQLDPIHLQLRFAEPEAGIPHHSTHRGNGLLPLLVNALKWGEIVWIGAVTQTQSVQNGIAVR